jgi:hypothetical protein
MPYEHLLTLLIKLSPTPKPILELWSIGAIASEDRSFVFLKEMGFPNQ